MLENEVPTRAEIAELLDSVPSKKGTKVSKQGRNAQRKLKVKETIPISVFNLVESDLPSYPEWEIETDDDAP